MPSDWKGSRGYETFRQACAAFGCSGVPAVLALDLETRRAFEARWLDLLYEGSGVDPMAPDPKRQGPRVGALRLLPATRPAAMSHLELARAARAAKASATRQRIAALHAEGLTDTEIAAHLGMTRQGVAVARRALHLEPNGEVGALRRFHADLRRLVEAGFTDAEIAARLGKRQEQVESSRRTLGYFHRPNVRTFARLAKRAEAA